MKKATKIAAVVAAAAVVTFAGVGGAVAAGKITGDQIATRTIHGQNIATGTLGSALLTPGARDSLRGPKGATGKAGANGSNGSKGNTGAPGAKGDTGPAGAGFQDAYYATAKYDVGDTNGGAIATVACQSQSDTAISGGVQTLGLGGDTNPAVISSSFPGRMDWTTNTPKPDRLDGWIVQFDNSAGAPAPAKVTLWALCVPHLNNMTVVNTFTESG